MLERVRKAMLVVERVLGLPFNINKTQFMGAGAAGIEVEWGVCVEKTKYLGIWIPREENRVAFKEKVKAIERVVGMLRGWGVGIHVAVVVWNTFCVSRLVYLAAMVNIDSEIVRELEWAQRRIAGIVWEGKATGRQQYIGRKLTVVERPWAQGGIGLRQVRAQLESITGIWARVVIDGGWIPAHWAVVREWIEVNFVRRQTVEFWNSCREEGGQIEVAKAYKNLIVGEAVTAQDKAWWHIWARVKGWEEWKREWAWRVCFNIVDTPENRLRWADVCEEWPCVECGVHTIRGVTHTLQCKGRRGDQMSVEKGVTAHTVWAWMGRAEADQIEWVVERVAEHWRHKKTRPPPLKRRKTISDAEVQKLKEIVDRVASGERMQQVMAGQEEERDGPWKWRREGRQQDKSQEERQRDKETQKQVHKREREEQEWKMAKEAAEISQKYEQAQRVVKERETARLQERMRMAGQELIEVAGDGNCLFRAVAVGMGEREGNYRHYRELAERGAELLEQDMGGGEFAGREREGMRQEGAWAGESALAAIARATGQRVRVITGLEGWEGGVYGSGEREIVVGYNGHNHYWGARGWGSRIRRNGMGAPLNRPEEEEWGNRRQ